MNIRKGSTRLARFVLGLIWAAWLFLAVMGGNPEVAGEYLVYMLVFTGAYVLFCKAVAWVFNGFFSPPSSSPARE